MEKVSIFKRFLPIQFLAFGGFLLSFLSFFCNIFVLSPLISISFIPQPQITIPVVNIISCIICILVLIFPKTIFFSICGINYSICNDFFYGIRWS